MPSLTRFLDNRFGGNCAEGRSGIAGGLAAAINATDAPLSQGEMAWNEDHHLGLEIDWRQTDGE